MNLEIIVNNPNVNLSGSIVTNPFRSISVASLTNSAIDTGQSTTEPKEILVKRSTGVYIQYILGMTYTITQPGGVGTNWFITFTDFIGTETNVTVYWR